MELSLVFDFWSLGSFILIVLISFVMYKNLDCEFRTIAMAEFSFYLCFAVSLFVLIYVLRDITNLALVGKGLSFVILLNFYSALLNVVCRVIRALKKLKQ